MSMCDCTVSTVSEDGAVSEGGTVSEGQTAVHPDLYFVHLHLIVKDHKIINILVIDIVPVQMTLTTSMVIEGSFRDLKQLLLMLWLFSSGKTQKIGCICRKLINCFCLHSK